MWNVRRLCSRILWMDRGEVRAYGPASEIAERYMNEVNLEALANERSALQSHRRGTGEIRFTSVQLFDAAGRGVKTVRSGGALSIAAEYQTSHPVRTPLFHVSIVDVDTGFVVTTAASDPAAVSMADGPGGVRFTFDQLPLKPRHYIVRLAIFDRHKAVEYDYVTAGPRFAVAAQFDGGGAQDDDDGFVSLPYEFEQCAASRAI
jgi:hypothetical protein